LVPKINRRAPGGSPKFLKLNPNGQVPVLDDVGLMSQRSLWVVNEVEHLLIAIL